jgi:putative Mg2+ transporter-C (MgtC) family protein
MKEGLNVRGLNTAATLWGSAAAGACAGAGLLDAALLDAIFVLAANTLLRPVVNSINRTPLDDEHSEVTYQLCVISDEEQQNWLFHDRCAAGAGAVPAGRRECRAVW